MLSVRVANLKFAFVPSVEEGGDVAIYDDVPSLPQPYRRSNTGTVQPGIVHRR